MIGAAASLRFEQSMQPDVGALPSSSHWAERCLYPKADILLCDNEQRDETQLTTPRPTESFAKDVRH